MKFTDTAFMAGIIGEYEANEIETWIDSVIIENTIMTFEPPKHLKPLFDKECLFRAGGTMQ